MRWFKLFILAVFAVFSMYGIGLLSPVQQIESTLRSDVQKFESSVDALHQAAQRFTKNELFVLALQQQVAQTRKQYKKIEFIAQFYFPSFVEEYINGAPLYHLKKSDLKSTVVPPEGLQVIDELVHGDDFQKIDLELLTGKLNNQTKHLTKALLEQPLNEAAILEAIQLEIIAIYTLSVTGFDTPGSANGLQEATVALKQIRNNAVAFIDPSNAAKFVKPIEVGLQMLNQADFETFDRLKFLKQSINPLYKQVVQLRQKLHPNAPKAGLHAINLTATNLFDANLINPYTYTELKSKDDTEAMRALGQKLFYDQKLSRSKNMSCATCHNPQMAFTDGLPRSNSNTKNTSVQRNAPTLLNAVYADRYFYDLSAFTLEQQAEHVLYNPLEYNTTYDEIVTYLKSNTEYKKGFKSAFGDVQIDQDRFSKALAAYTLSLQSFNSPFDQYVRGEIDEISEEVRLGYNLFMGKSACATCHFPPTFAGLVPPHYLKSETEILGVLNQPSAEGTKPMLDADMGRFENNVIAEHEWIYERSFKTTTVRNAAVTAPYFHNGAYPDLQSVIDFYNHGGGAGLGLEVKNQTLAPDSLHLTNNEQAALIAFIESLTDTTQLY